MSMALVMSEMPDVYRRVLAEHVPDAGGRCSACRNVSGETASWPCQTYRIAQEAKWVGEGNLPGTGPHGSVSPRGGSAAARRSEPPYSMGTARTGDVPDLGFSDRPASELLPQREGGRRRREEAPQADAQYRAQGNVPYGLDDNPRHAAP